MPIKNFLSVACRFYLLVSLTLFSACGQEEDLVESVDLEPLDVNPLFSDQEESAIHIDGKQTEEIDKNYKASPKKNSLSIVYLR